MKIKLPHGVLLLISIVALRAESLISSCKYRYDGYCFPFHAGGNFQIPGIVKLRAGMFFQIYEPMGRQIYANKPIERQMIHNDTWYINQVIFCRPAVSSKYKQNFVWEKESHGRSSQFKDDQRKEFVHTYEVSVLISYMTLLCGRKCNSNIFLWRIYLDDFS